MRCCPAEFRYIPQHIIPAENEGVGSGKIMRNDHIGTVDL